MKKTLKKTLAVFLTLVMLVGFIPLGKPLFEITSFDAKAADVTMAEFQAKLNTFKSSVYKHNSTYVDNPSATGGYQCFGFANELAKYIFGSYPTNSMDAKTVNSKWQVTYGGNSVDSLCVGDIVRYLFHSIFITKIDGDNIYYCQANSPSGTNRVTYDNVITRTNLKNNVSKKLTHTNATQTGWVAHFKESKVVSNPFDQIADGYTYHSTLYYDATNPYNNVYGNSAYAYQCYTNPNGFGDYKPAIFVQNGKIVRDSAINNNLLKMHLAQAYNTLIANSLKMETAKEYISIANQIKVNEVLEDIGSIASKSLGTIGSIYLTGGATTSSQIASIVAKQTVDQFIDHIKNIVQIISDAQLTYFLLTTKELQLYITKIEEIKDFNTFANCEKYADYVEMFEKSQACATELMRNLSPYLSDKYNFWNVVLQFAKDVASGFVGEFSDYLLSSKELESMMKNSPEYFGKIILFTSKIHKCNKTVEDFGEVLMSAKEFCNSDLFSIVDAYNARENIVTFEKLLSSFHKNALSLHPSTNSGSNTPQYIAIDFNPTIKDGIYTLKIAHTSGKMLNVYNGSVSCPNGTDLTTWAKDGTADQKFYFKHETGGKYRIYAVCSGANGSVYNKVVDVNVGSNNTVDLGDTFDVWEKDTKWDNCQLFYIVPIGSGKYVIELASKPSAVLSATNTTEAAKNGGTISLLSYTASTTQQWYFYNESGTAQVDPSKDAYSKDTTYFPGKYKIADDDGLNVRVGAGTSYVKLGALQKNVEVNVVEVSSNWGKITYNGTTGWICLDYTTYVSPIVTSITVKTFPSKTSYYINDSLSLSGLTLTANFSNNTSAVISMGFTCAMSTLTTLGKQKIYVNYGGSTTYFEVDVLDRSYTISYSASGSENVPASQIKYHSTPLVLSSTVPTKAGYTFLGWDTNSTATTVIYHPGDSFSINANTTLYAVWEKNVHVHTPGAAATCTTPQTCTTCGTILVSAKGHTYNIINYEEAHPHKEYAKCGCGDYYYTGNTLTLIECEDCMLTAESTSITFNGHTYTLIKAKGTWWDALRYCFQKNGYLATITSAKEQEIINHLNSEDLYLWIGAYDYWEEGKWEWVTGEPFEYTNWISGEPNNSEGGENYSGTYGHNNAWNDFKDDHGEIIGFIMEQELSLSLSDQSTLEIKDGFILKTPSNITSDTIISNFENTSIQVVDINGNEVSSNSIIGTGYKVQLIINGETIDSLTIIIAGDVNGNGNVDTTDYLRIKSAFLGMYELNDTAFKASDVDGDSRITTTDYLKIKGHFLGAYNLYS